jgi:hypothetical protein
VEQSVLGGCAHLLNFDGTDTMSAAFYAQFHLNNGQPVGELAALHFAALCCIAEGVGAVHFQAGCLSVVFLAMVLP